MLKTLLYSEKTRYLISGIWNTFFGYITMITLYELLSAKLHLVLISIMAHIIAISMAFAVNKLFVFKTNGKWLEEYIRSYIVYGNMAFFAIFLLWLMVDKLNITIWLAQGLITFTSLIISYIGHSKFTFKKRST